MDLLVLLLAHLMGHLFLEFNATLGFHLHTLLGIEKVLWVAAEKCPVDSDLLALVVHPLTDLSVLKVT